MNFDDLSTELQEKARACKTPEDILALAKETGYELSDGELNAIAGGTDWGCMVNELCEEVCHGNAPYVP